MKKQEYDFIAVTDSQWHSERSRAILKAHPEVKALITHNRMSAFWICLIVSLQFALAFAFSNSSWWVIVLFSFLIGAVAHHGLFVLIHDAGHNLIFKQTLPNRLIALFADFCMILPTSQGFRYYHHYHHSHLGQIGFDADLAGDLERKLVANSWWRKIIWLFLFIFIEGFYRPALLKIQKTIQPWVLINLTIQIIVSIVVVELLGWKSFSYLLLSTFFSVGLHPVGARWIQEHYLFRTGQETYSYYGPYNWFCFNIGYHVEHHDMLKVPWNNLPKLRQMAPEFYQDLYSHSSYTKLLFRFIFDSKIGLHSRMVRVSS